MANAVYDLGRQSFLSDSPAIDMDTDTIKAALIDDTYVPNLATDQYVDPALGAAGAKIIASAALASRTVLAGVFDAADVTFAAVATGKTVKYVAIYKDTGVLTTSPLIALIDTAAVNGGASGAMSLLTNGGDITITWDNGANKIFKV